MLSAEMQSLEAAHVGEVFAAFVVCWTDHDLPLFFPNTICSFLQKIQKLSDSKKS